MKCFYVVLAIFLSKIIFAQDLKLADSLIAIGQFNKAIVEYERLTSHSKYFKIAKVFESKGNTREAFKNYKKYLEIDSLNLVVNYNYGLLLLESSKYKEAQGVFQQLIQANSSVVYQYYLGIIFEKLGDNSKAFESYKEASKIDSLYVKSNYKLAVMHTNHKEFDNALSITNRFLKENKEDIEMLKLRAQIYFAQEKFDKAIQDFEQLIVLNQNDSFIFQKLAKAYYENKQYKESITVYSNLIEKEEEPDYYLNRGINYGYIDKLSEAESDIRKAIDLKTYTFENEYFYLGYFYQKKEDFKKALWYYKKAIKQDKNHLEANYQLVLIKEYLGNSKKETIKEYEFFLKKFKTISNEKKHYIETRLKVLRE